MKEKTNPSLGLEIRDHLLSLGVETPIASVALAANDDAKIAVIEEHMHRIMETLGLDMGDDSLYDTPKRVAKMFVNELYWGLKTENFPKCTTVENKMGYDEMVLEKNIKVMSDCEHHLRTIVGKAHVAYIPKEKVLGLSKLNRVVEYFSRRPQIQERLAEQIYHALSYILGTPDVAVVIDAEHFCVKQRGIEDVGSSTVTSKLGGCFREGTVRAEFLSLIKGV
ncbi:GTP cyclohydrolase [Acidovorax phage ACP17]|uniref:GTP cyclohydrolase I n=1 Tax=Acidovorax phage ACP17 TaxID=2010329 RepID=A0A218M2Y0_9CAUD|nr:GTP cyclohydrolase [Acidovorax phage ACP17]ASD50401.1 GTP cyclohydrolase I type 1 [Acidovorax phage ACP17]